MNNTASRNQTNVSKLSRNDRLSAVLAVTLTFGAIALGLLFRQEATNQTWLFESRAAGIAARYPAGWLVDERGNYVARIRDPRARPYKTQYVISVVPVSSQSTVRNVLDSLTLQRASDLAAYRVLLVEEIATSGAARTRMRFAFVDADPNPFIQRLPVVVLGEDIIILDGNRAIVATFMADKDAYDTDHPAFERFLASLRH